MAVREQDAYTNLLLPAVLRRHGLTGRDAGLVTELVSGTVRRQGTYDAVLTACVDRPLRRVSPDVLDVLRLHRVVVHDRLELALDDRVGCTGRRVQEVAALINEIRNAETELRADDSKGLSNAVPRSLDVG